MYSGQENVVKMSKLKMTSLLTLLLSNSTKTMLKYHNSLIISLYLLQLALYIFISHLSGRSNNFNKKLVLKQVLV